MQPEVGKLDNEGTTAGQATEMLQKLFSAFGRDEEKLAIALGRTREEMAHALSGNSEAFDDDLMMKMKGVAKERGIEL
jgi:hypothetical protein